MSTPSPEPAARSRRPAEESVPTEPPSEDETPKRTRRAPAAKKAVPKKAAPPVKKAAPAVKKATRTAKSAKTPTTTEASTAATDATAVTATPPAPETPPSAVDPAEPAAAAGDQALAVDQPAVNESRKTEPPALDSSIEEQPYDKTETLSVTVDGRHAARTQEKGWRAVGPQLRDHPGFAPELLALAAVDALGPRAREWVAQVRRAYPEADADGVARLATRRFVRMAGTGGALAAGAGMFAPVAELAAVLWTQANLVLHLAAAYGRDPAHPDRAAELLVLTLVHPDEGTARAALGAARAADEPADGPWGRVAEAAWRLATPVAAQAGGWLGLRLAARRLPGAAALAATIGGTATAERVAARAVARYRPGRT
ncbi:hypothetical protein [Micromonospora sp. CMU55-4]|uniref:hypothetical protein n=1 Tax=Micromonospora sp. CMU55-4 TaxID=2717028 RepID=UPI001F0F2F28|nr:hypothetical protein [Micromonospora sp. CMU55-4]